MNVGLCYGFHANCERQHNHIPQLSDSKLMIRLFTACHVHSFRPSIYWYSSVLQPILLSLLSVRLLNLLTWIRYGLAAEIKHNLRTDRSVSIHLVIVSQIIVTWRREVMLKYICNCWTRFASRTDCGMMSGSKYVALRIIRRAEQNLHRLTVLSVLKVFECFCILQANSPFCSAHFSGTGWTCLIYRELQVPQNKASGVLEVQ